MTDIKKTKRQTEVNKRLQKHWVTQTSTNKRCSPNWESGLALLSGTRGVTVKWYEHHMIEIVCGHRYSLMNTKNMNKIWNPTKNMGAKKNLTFVRRDRRGHHYKKLQCRIHVYNWKKRATRAQLKMGEGKVL